MNHYYILEDGNLIESKWDKQPGDAHLRSKVKSVIDKQAYDELNQEMMRNHNRAVREANKNANLWLAAQILGAGKSLGIPVDDTLSVMKDLAPSSLHALNKLV